MAERRRLRVTGFVPVEAKFRASVRREGLVPRGELVDRLLEGRDRPVVLVTAPAGYGKSVLISQWAEQDPRPFAWLTLEATDDEPTVLLTYLLLALHRVEAVDAAVLALATDRRRAARVALDRLGRMLGERERSFVLVLDCVEALASPSALEVLHTVVDHLPAGSQLALVGRTAPALEWSALRDQDRLLELDRHDLRLSRAEARALVESVGRRPTETELDTLLDRTEGWAAGLYLAALALVPTDEASDVATALGTDSLIADYVREELLTDLAPADLTFLLRASVLDRLSGPLCDAVLDTTGSLQTLERVAESNTLIAAVEGEPGWFRLHQLFSEVLQAELRRLEPAQLKRLHARASRWFEAHDQPEAAIASAIAAGEAEPAARLIWSQAPGCLATGRLARLEGWLGAFTTRQLTAHSELALAAGWLALQSGRAADHWVSAAERGQHASALKGGSASVAAATALLRAALARNGLVQMGADAELALRLQEPEDPWASTAGVLDAVSTYLTGHLVEARSKLEAVEGRAAAAGAHDARALALGELALLVLDDDPPAAQALIDAAEGLMREHGLDQLAMLVPVHCVSALLAAQPGRSEDAAALVQRYVRRLALAGPPAAWAGVQCRQLLARAELLLGDPAAGRAILSEAQSLLAEMPEAVVLRTSVEETWRQLELLPLQGSLGTSALTTAELRVLQYLPTHLSFEEIGRELFVSRNTVKTQAVAAYRKLGVTSRADAVERGYVLGLIAR